MPDEALASRYPRYGYLMLHGMLKQEGLVIDAKQTYRDRQQRGQACGSVTRAAGSMRRLLGKLNSTVRHRLPTNQEKAGPHVSTSDARMAVFAKACIWVLPIVSIALPSRFPLGGNQVLFVSSPPRCPAAPLRTRITAPGSRSWLYPHRWEI
jgi:hypothetical protein